MALISTLPNFFNAAGPVAADFNNAAKALAGQVGGTYYDEAATAIVQAQGNLDATNIVSGAAIRNYQKAEPYALMNIFMRGKCTLNTQQTGSTTWAANDTGIPSGTMGNPLPVLGPVGADMVVMSLQFSTQTQDAITPVLYVVGGSFDTFLNGSYLTTYSHQTIGTTTQADGGSCVACGIKLRVGDFLYIDVTNTRTLDGRTATTFKTDGAFTGPRNIAFSITAFCKAVHVR
jgi:hypothetical protein